MDDQEPPFSPDIPPETENPLPKTQEFSNENSFPFDDGQKHSHATGTKMENFKAFLLRYALSSSPTKSLSPLQRSMIEQRLHDFFPDFHTPDHPPYAAMIEHAIEKLNEEGGSTEEAISLFIRKEYPDLPRAHDSLFKYHLKNLCEDGAVVKAGNRFYMTGDEHSPDSLYNLSHIVTHSNIYSPTSHDGVESSPSSPSWCSSTSCSSFSSPRSNRPYARRQKRGGKRGRQRRRTTQRKRVQIKRKGKRVERRGRPRKKNVEDQVYSDKLMLEEEVKELEEQNVRKKEQNEVLEGCDQVRRKRRKIECGQSQETRALRDTDFDQFEVATKEEWRKKHSQEKSVSRDNSQAEELEKQREDQAHYIEGKEEEDQPLQNHSEVNLVCMLQQEAEVEVVGQEDYLKDGLRETTAQLDIAKEENLVIQVIARESCMEDIVLVVTGEPSLLEEHDIQTVRESTEEQRKRAQPCKRTVRGRKAHKKSVPIPGRRRGRPKKDLLVEASQTNAEEMEANETQEVMLEEKTEVIKEQNEVKEGALGIEGTNQVHGHGQESFGCSLAEETVTETEIGKPGVIAEEIVSGEQHNMVIKQESQLIGGTERSDKQQEHENIDQECYLSGKAKNEAFKEQNKPHRQQNLEQNQLVEKNIESSTAQEVEMHEMHNQNPKIQQKFHLEGEHEDAERLITSKATTLPTETSSQVYEEEVEVSNMDMDWQNEIPGKEEDTKIYGKHACAQPDFPTSELSSKLKSVEISSLSQLLQLPGPMSEEEKEGPSMKNKEPQVGSPVQAGDVEITDKPELFSSESSLKLKSEEVSIQPGSLEQPQQGQEKPQRLWRWLLNFL
ncbi:unnamed protein product [Coffea canephora]|uniref:H15 domain-containing protein n=1 Tax=Coffea canephora TaxID=49390 RepID=A0A068TXL2_COFCA|nr:unnamed protein product [Coffea canephora]